MKKNSSPRPPTASSAKWHAQRSKLLRHEKEVTKHYDRVAAERRRLPMVKVDKKYSFASPGGKRSLRELFEGRRQLIIYHFMFDPDWDAGCPGCTGYVDGLGDLSLLAERDTTFALVSRAPLAKLRAYKKKKRWVQAWYSSFGSDFNYDYHVTLDDKVTPVVYDYRSKAEMVRLEVPNPTEGETHGISVFFRAGTDVYHTYSTYARGVEGLTDAVRLLDLTPFGRQQDWEDSPRGWPQRPTYGG
jgi:predicted dithiol-disulfide oxidoreductase (DUF899 family)